MARPRRRRPERGAGRGSPRTGRLQAQGRPRRRPAKPRRWAWSLSQSPGGGHAAPQGARPSRSPWACSAAATTPTTTTHADHDHRPTTRRPSDGARRREHHRRRTTRERPLHGRGPRRRALLRARGLAVLRARRCATGCSPAGHEVLWVEIGRDGVWRCDGERLSLTPGRRAARGRCRLPGAARPVRRGRHRPGPARDARRPLRRRRRGRLGRVPRQGALQGADVARPGCRRSTTSGVRAERFRARARAGARRSSRALGLPVFVKPAHLGSSVGIVKVTRPRSSPAALERGVRPRRARDRRGDGARASRSSAACSELAARALAEAPPALASEPGRDRLRRRLLRLRGEVHAGRDGADRSPRGSRPTRASARARARARAFDARRLRRAWRASTSSSTASRCSSTSSTRCPASRRRASTRSCSTPRAIAYPQLVDRLCRLALERHARSARASPATRAAPPHLNSVTSAIVADCMPGRQRRHPHQVVAVGGARPACSGIRSPLRT